MKLLIKETLCNNEMTQILDNVYDKVKAASEALVNDTLLKLEEMNPEIASELEPEFKRPTWDSAFKFTLNSDNNVPLNKRGSGVRRLILLNFFRAEAERRKKERNVQNIIYAFEEPETAQHPQHQKMLIEAFIELSKQDINQIILTTHSPGIAKLLPTESLRLIKKESNLVEIEMPYNNILNEICDELGLLPSIKLSNLNKVKLALCVEGKNDIEFLTNINNVIPELKNIIDINDERIIILPLGGSTLQYWVNKEYLKRLNLREVHIYDSDIGSEEPHKYKRYVDKINERENCKAFETNLREMENYVTPKVFIDKLTQDYNFEQWRTLNVPEQFAKFTFKISEGFSETHQWESLSDSNKKRKISNAKNRINHDYACKVKKQYLEDLNIYSEIETWFTTMRTLLEGN